MSAPRQHDMRTRASHLICDPPFQSSFLGRFLRCKKRDHSDCRDNAGAIMTLNPSSTNPSYSWRHYDLHLLYTFNQLKYAIQVLLSHLAPALRCQKSQTDPFWHSWSSWQVWSFLSLGKRRRKMPETASFWVSLLSYRHCSLSVHFQQSSHLIANNTCIPSANASHSSRSPL